MQLQLVRLVGSLALSFYCSVALSLVRCVVPLQSWLVIKIGIVINSSVRSTWRIIALSLAGVMENASRLCPPATFPHPDCHAHWIKLPLITWQRCQLHFLTDPIPAPSSPLSLRELRIKVDKVLPSVAPFFPHTTLYPREGAYR